MGWLFINRVFQYFARFAMASENLGFTSACKVFLLRMFSAPPAANRIWIKKLRRSFYFRGRDDGVVGHFFFQGGSAYRIRAFGEHGVRFIVDAGANIGTQK